VEKKTISRLSSPSQQLLPLFSIPSPSSEPRSSLPLLHHRKLSLEASAILHNQPAILHNGIADPSHHSEPPHKPFIAAAMQSTQYLTPLPNQPSFPFKSTVKAAVTKTNGSTNQPSISLICDTQKLM